MTTLNTNASVNEMECSWSDIAVTIQIDDGQDVDGLDWSGIKWSRKVDVGVRKGPSGGRPMARTRGEVSYDASGTMARSSWATLIEQLAKVAPQRGNQRLISVVAFTIVVQHTPLGSDKIYTTKIKGCRLLGDSSDMKEGPDAEQIECTLNPIEVATVLPDGTEVVLL